MLIVLLIVPQTRKPLMVEFNRLFAFSPSRISEENREMLTNYNWNLYGLDGKDMNLNQAQGKVAIVNLWATWCPPCIAEMPSFQALYEDYGERVAFYFVSSEDIEQLEKFMNKNEYTFPVVRPGSAAPIILRSRTLPTTFVISKTGEIVIKKTGSADWNAPSFRKTLEELLHDD